MSALFVWAWGCLVGCGALFMLGFITGRYVRERQAVVALPQRDQRGRFLPVKRQ